MSLLGGRGGRSDDWSTQHARARARASERLDGPIDPDESSWLDEHLAGCSDCASAAAEYNTQRRELRTLRERTPQPPRDLWARTAASIEREARHRSLTPPRRRQRSILAPYALLAGALVVAVVVGTLSSSQRPIVSTASATSATGGPTATTPLASAGATPLAIALQEVDYLGRGRDGEFHLYTTNVSEVCPKDADTCAMTEPTSVRTIGPLSSPETVFGSGDAPLVVLGDGADGSSVFAVARPSPVVDPTPSPDVTAPPSPEVTGSSSPSDAASPSQPVQSASASPSASTQPTGSAEPTASASTSPEPPDTTPSPDGAIEIARGLEVVDTTAAYAPDGSAFAFTARPADGSHGPDIYLWRVGEAQAMPITTDHRSVFGSWAGDMIVGSTVVTSGEGATDEPAAFVASIDGDAAVLLPETGLAWRPVVDPNEGSAVYWAGSLEPTDDGLGWRTVEGRLVLGRWSVQEQSSSAPSATPLAGDQELERAETTLAEGPIADWDARWDETGTRLAVWIADEEDPTVGTLSLYVVDPFDGRIDLEEPPLFEEPALAGFSIADGRLAWSAPMAAEAESRVLILAWTDDGFGQVESAPGDFLLVR